jgi:hypothetical protein
LDLPLWTRLLSGLALAGLTLPSLAQNFAERTVSSAEVEAVFSRSIAKPRHEALPEELRMESAIYLQRRLNEWSQADARRTLGEPLRRRDALEKGTVIGDIYAFRDPTSRYREFELMFDKRTHQLRSVFIYPWSMTWEECRRLWGNDVNITQVANGNLFRAYLSRRLDVLTDKGGKVINLGIY